MQFAGYKKSCGGDQRLDRNGNPSGAFCRAPQWTLGNRRSGCMDSIRARIWPRETKGKAEGGSVILGIQNEYLEDRSTEENEGGGQG